MQPRLADGGRRRQRFGQVDADEGHCRRAEADGRHRAPSTKARASPICRNNPNSTGRFRRASSISSRWGFGRKRGLLGRFTAEDRETVSTALMAVGLAGFETRPLDTLSGGQLQRALFARVLVQDADLILLDEPFNADRCQDRQRPDRADQALARREAHRHGRRARSRPGARAFSRRRCFWRASPIAWGATARDAAAGKPACAPGVSTRPGKRMRRGASPRARP